MLWFLSKKCLLCKFCAKQLSNLKIWEICESLGLMMKGSKSNLYREKDGIWLKVMDTLYQYGRRGESVCIRISNNGIGKNLWTYISKTKIRSYLRNTTYWCHISNINITRFILLYDIADLPVPVPPTANVSGMKIENWINLEIHHWCQHHHSQECHHTHQQQ